jgi:ADP-ribose pyrophosphatase
MLKRWKTISTRTVHENPWWTYKVDNFEIPNKVAGEYHYVHTNGSSMVIPITDDRKLILVNQFRYLCGRESLEFPCGSLPLRGGQHGKSYLETAQMELQEETGYKAGDLEVIGEFNPYNGVTTEICTVFVAGQLKPGDAKKDPTEEFEVVYCSPEDMDRMIRDKSIWDGMTLAAWMLARDEVFERCRQSSE